jgi:hypothetical protein
MKTRLKILISAALTLLSLDLLSRFLQWMNRPSDGWFYAGALSALCLLVFVPAVLTAIWRDRIPGLNRP